MTQAEFAKQAGLSQPTWNLIIHGHRNLRLDKATIVAKLIGGDPNLWREGAAVKDRQKAWDIFCKEQQ